MSSCFIFLLVLNFITFINCNDDGFCYKKEDCENDLHSFFSHELNGMKYMIYDVNREKSNSVKLNVYINMARLVHDLGSNWTLVLPPWGLYAKPSAGIDFKNKIDWEDFFKIEILQELVPVIDFSTFLEHVANEMDLILILNRFDNSLPDLNEKNEVLQSNTYEFENDDDCKHIQFYEKDEHIYGLFFGYKDYLKAKKMSCIKVHGDNTVVKKVLDNELKHLSTIYLQNADLIKHPVQDDSTYWHFRKSIQLADSIMHRANKFRRKYFDSEDEKDKTFLISDLQLDQKLGKLNKQKQSNEAIGGQYLSVHLTNDLNDNFDNNLNFEDEKLKIEDAVKQIVFALKQNNLTLVYVATDGDDSSWSKLKSEFKEATKDLKSPDKYKLFRYKNKTNKLSSVELELIDQWICAHSRLFIGSSNSMFTQLIQEEREILGFKSSTTFNLFCKNNETDQLCTGKEKKVKY